MFAHLLIIIVCLRIALVASFVKSVNVGTVLFSQPDLYKINWDSSELGLLKARKHFQELLPPANFITTANEDYINNLLRYSRDTYTTIKRETTNETASRLMTVAFSDALGGYLKFWALPVTKIGFYSGTVSQNNIIKLSKFYEELKDFLDTDGNGWRSPNRNVLYDKTLSIAPPRHFRRSMRHPCKELIFEETPYGMTIPTPYIHWRNKSSTMIIPMKRNSVVLLESPNYPNCLVKYYDAAKNCIDESTVDALDFEDRFQTWLLRDVVPHLCDENVYLSLGQILSLINKTQIFGGKCFERVGHQFTIGGFPIDLTCTKSIIVFVILVLEVVWCIPALIYVACTCTRRITPQKKKPCCKPLYKPKPDTGLCDSSHDTQDSRDKIKPVRKIIDKIKEKKRNFLQTNNQCNMFGGQAGGGLKLEQKPRDKYAYDTILSITPSQPSFQPHIVTVRPSVSFERELNIPIKSSLKKIRSSHSSRLRNSVAVMQSKSQSSKTCASCCKVCSCSKCTSGSSHNIESFNFEHQEPAVPYVSTESIQKSVTETFSQITYVKSMSDKSFRKFDSRSITDDELSRRGSCVGPGIECPCLDCMGNTKDSLVTVLSQVSPPPEPVMERKLDADTQVQLPVIKESVCKNIGVSLSPGQSRFEIKIDKPRTEISVGITGLFDKKKVKPSKIPKKLPNAIALQLTCQSNKETRLTSRIRSMIPQPTIGKEVLDDMAIHHRKTMHKYKDDKLNVTL